MKIMITIISFIIVLAGLVPIFASFGLMPSFIPTTKPGYHILITVIGVGGIVYAILNSMLMGSERFVTLCVAGLTILGGIYPLIANYVALPSFLPTEGALYSLLIIIVGGIGLIYGLLGMG